MILFSYVVSKIEGEIKELKRTGKGQYIDVSQVESLLKFFYDITYLSITGEEIGKTRNIDP